MKTTLYALYGILAHEKKPVYRTYKLKDAITEECTVEIPDELYPVEGEADQIIITLEGMQCLLNDVLDADKDDNPIIWLDPYHSRKLEVIK